MGTFQLEQGWFLRSAHCGALFRIRLSLRRARLRRIKMEKFSTAPGELHIHPLIYACGKECEREPRRRNNEFIDLPVVEKEKQNTSPCDCQPSQTVRW
jgi:hypothetical protein